eukprot:5841749-Pyramimonas_sp.AAC.1
MTRAACARGNAAARKKEGGARCRQHAIQWAHNDQEHDLSLNASMVDNAKIHGVASSGPPTQATGVSEVISEHQSVLGESEDISARPGAHRQ